MTGKRIAAADSETYRVVAAHHDREWVVGKGFRSLSAAEAFQSRKLDEMPGTDFYVESES